MTKGLVINYGSGGVLQNGRGGGGGAVARQGAEKVLAMLKEGAQKVLR